VIRLGLRLALAGGREAITRLALIAVAVAVGVGLLLATVAGLNAVSTQNARYAWLETGYTGSNAPPAGSPTAEQGSADPLWWRLRADYYQGKEIGRIDVAPTGPHAPIPPGIAKLPASGQFYASPALARLLRNTPAAQLGDRYPGHQVGTIGPAALPSPDSLIIIIGRTVVDMSHQDDAHLVNNISTTSPSSCNGPDCAFGVGTHHNGIVLILAVVIAALLFPVLIFIGGATRLSAARREQRFAAMRLVGATPRQISVISTVESVLATVIGVAAGFGLFYVLRPAIATIPFTSNSFFASDLSLTVPDILFAVIGIPLGAAVAARLALRRVSISPLGVSRRIARRPPRAWRLIPVLVGIAELGYFAYVHDIGAGTHTNTTKEAVLFLIGVLLVMAGLVIAGPWLTMLASRLVIRQASRPATLIAARRLADNPQTAFRAISGLVLAVFVGTCAIAIITTISAGNSTTGGLGSATDSTLIDFLSQPSETTQSTSSVAAATDTVRSISGVTGVAVIHDATGPQQEGLLGPIEQVVSCADLATVPALGHCPPGAATVMISPDYGGGSGLQRQRSMSETTWPAASVSTSQLQQLPIDSIVVGTDGSAAALEQARTALDLAYPVSFAPETGGELQADQSRRLNDYRRLADVVILTSLPIAGCSLAVSIAGGLIERKRPFSLLRLTGAPLAVLRRVIGLEAAAPLLVTAAASVGAALLAAHLFLRAQLHLTLQAPGLSYYVVLAVGLLASLAVIASTLPLLNRITGPETARNE
jgi:FtsX-like permease family protein